MSKTDQLRRPREAHYAQQEKQASGSAAKLETIPTEKVDAVPLRVAARAKPGADAQEGKCAACGKLRALANGLVSNHQKGLGKMRPGSRKEPA